MIRKIFVRISLVAAMMAASCSTLTNMASFVTCNYNLQNVVNPSIAGVNLTGKDALKLDAVTALKITTGLLAGSLPLAATVNVGVTNPNAAAAQLAGLDWSLFFQNVNMLSGTTQQQIYVAPNGGQSTVPFSVQVDLASLFNKDSRDNMLQFANGLMHLGESTSKVSLKIRPAFSIGGQVIRPSGYITVNKTI